MSEFITNNPGWATICFIVLCITLYNITDSLANSNNKKDK